MMVCRCKVIADQASLLPGNKFLMQHDEISKYHRPTDLTVGGAGVFDEMDGGT